MCEAASLRNRKVVHHFQGLDRLAGLPLMPKQGHAQSDNDSGPRLRGEGTNLGNG